MTMDVGQAGTQWESPLWAHRGAQVPAQENFKVLNLFNFLGIPKTNQEIMHYFLICFRCKIFEAIIFIFFNRIVWEKK